MSESSSELHGWPGRSIRPITGWDKMILAILVNFFTSVSNELSKSQCVSDASRKKENTTQLRRFTSTP